MRSPAVTLCAALIAACGALPATREPGAGHTLRYVAITAGRHEGDGVIRIEDGGVRSEWFRMNDRGRGPELRSAIAIDADGMPRWYRVTGHDYWKAPVDERLDRDGDRLRWRSTSEHGEAAAGSYFVPTNPPLDGDAVLARALLRAPGRRLKTLPAGDVWIEADDPRDVTSRGEVLHLRRIAIAGMYLSPSLVWLDADGELFASVSPWSSVIRAGHEALIAELVADDQRWTDARSAAQAKQLAQTAPAAGVAITHARLFDAERKTIVPDATVIV